MSMTSTQRDRIRRDLGDVASAFTDPELDDNWDRLTSAPNDDVRFEATKGLCFEQLLNSAAKLHDYSAGAVDEKLKQVRDNLLERFKYYLPALEAARGQKKQIVVGKLGMRENAERYTPSENLSTSRRRRW